MVIWKISPSIHLRLTAYVNETIQETEDGAGKLNQAMEDGAEDKTMF